MNKGNYFEKWTDFFQNFFHQCKHSIVWNWFIVKIILVSKKIFVWYILELVENQTEFPRLEQRSVIKVLVAEEWKPWEIYRRMCDVFREACFSQKMFTTVLNMLCHFKPVSKR